MYTITKTITVHWKWVSSINWEYRPSFGWIFVYPLASFERIFILGNVFFRYWYVTATGISDEKAQINSTLATSSVAETKRRSNGCCVFASLLLWPLVYHNNTVFDNRQFNYHPVPFVQIPGLNTHTGVSWLAHTDAVTRFWNKVRSGRQWSTSPHYLFKHLYFDRVYFVTMEFYCHMWWNILTSRLVLASPLSASRMSLKNTDQIRRGTHNKSPGPDPLLKSSWILQQPRKYTTRGQCDLVGKLPLHISARSQIQSSR